jgi:hypothetical protein
MKSAPPEGMAGDGALTPYGEGVRAPWGDEVRDPWGDACGDVPWAPPPGANDGGTRCAVPARGDGAGESFGPSAGDEPPDLGGVGGGAVAGCVGR